MKYSEWSAVWLQNFVMPSAKRRTYAKYTQIIRLHILPALGEYTLDDFTPLILQQFVSDLTQSGNLRTGQGLSAGTVNNIISIVQSSVRTAAGVGVIKTDISKELKRPKLREKQVESFSKAEQKKLESAILEGKKTKYYGIVLCLYTGLRIGELLALKWCDIDWKASLLRVCRTCFDGKDDRGKYARLEDSPKTDAANRQIPLPPQMIALLHTLRTSAKTEYVIETRNAKLPSVRAYQRAFELLLKRLNIPHKGFHALRHTFATRAVECGMDVKTLSEILGHQNPSLTLKRYVHSLMEHKREMMCLVGKLL